MNSVKQDWSTPVWQAGVLYVWSGRSLGPALIGGSSVRSASDPCPVFCPASRLVSALQFLQLAGYDMDKNVITRIETNQRYVTDLELQALSRIFHVSYDYLIDGRDREEHT